MLRDKVLTLPDATGTVLSNVSTLAGLNKTPLFAPRGFMINGKIVPTDASGITVALKTLVGTDPSATDPIYIRIGDTVRSITSALSVVLADGTNWMNAGSAELATQEIDYFVYAVYDSNSSTVSLSFARIPYANLVSDFSATTTNEKYCAGYSGFTTTDEVENIGRFAATLSAGAGYTWSVPTYTTINLIQRPIWETRDLSWNCVLAWTGSAAPTSENNNFKLVKYKIRSNEIFIQQLRLFTEAGTSITASTGTLPFLPNSQGLSSGAYYLMICGMGVNTVNTVGHVNSIDNKISLFSSAVAAVQFFVAGRYLI